MIIITIIDKLTTSSIDNHYVMYIIIHPNTTFRALFGNNMDKTLRASTIIGTFYNKESKNTDSFPPRPLLMIKI